MNLLEETKQVLSWHNLTLDDINWWGTFNSRYPLDDLEKILDIEYDDSFGTQKINKNLVIVGKDWWLERHECDGAEWWEFKRKPTPSDNIILEPKII